MRACCYSHYSFRLIYKKKQYPYATACCAFSNSDETAVSSKNSVTKTLTYNLWRKRHSRSGGRNLWKRKMSSLLKQSEIMENYSNPPPPFPNSVCVRHGSTSAWSVEVWLAAIFIFQPMGVEERGGFLSFWRAVAFSFSSQFLLPTQRPFWKRRKRRRRRRTKLGVGERGRKEIEEEGQLAKRIACQLFRRHRRL